MTLTQRQPRIEDPAWLAQVRKMPCLVCHRPGPNDPAHIRSAAPQYGKRHTGFGEKPDDRWVTPLCRHHHDEQHARGDELAWWISKGIPDPHGEAKALYAKRPADLRPLPAPAKPKRVSVRKPVGQRRKIAKGPKLESRSRLPSKGEGRKFEARKPRQIGNGE